MIFKHNLHFIDDPLVTSTSRTEVIQFQALCESKFIEILTYKDGRVLENVETAKKEVDLTS